MHPTTKDNADTPAPNIRLGVSQSVTVVFISAPGPARLGRPATRPAGGRGGPARSRSESDIDAEAEQLPATSFRVTGSSPTPTPSLCEWRTLSTRIFDLNEEP